MQGDSDDSSDDEFSQQQKQTRTVRGPKSLPPGLFERDEQRNQRDEM